MNETKDEAIYRCPLDYAMEIFGGKWKTRLLCMLSQKEVLRYNELRDEMIDITDAVLSKALKELIEDDMIERKQYNEIPVRVEYSLSEKGQSLIPILEQIGLWSKKYMDEDMISINLCRDYVLLKDRE